MMELQYGKRTTGMYCHACGNDFSATLDMDLNGNHEIECPHCGHIHYRVVKDREVTEERYRSSAGGIYYATTNTATISYTSSATVGGYFLRDVWASSSGTG